MARHALSLHIYLHGARLRGIIRVTSRRSLYIFNEFTCFLFGNLSAAFCILKTSIASNKYAILHIHIRYRLPAAAFPAQERADISRFNRFKYPVCVGGGINLFISIIYTICPESGAPFCGGKIPRISLETVKNDL